MDSPRAQFVVTPWRDSKELLRLRHDLYGPDIPRKERAVNKVFAWRLRKPEGLPLLLDSTADIVDVVLQDGRGTLTHNASRLLYATALSRFITGLLDTQSDLTHSKPSWFLPGKSLQLPLPLLEVRHRIVHRHLPSLAELKRAAHDSLAWLWEWYWRQLDHAFGLVKDDNEGEAEGGEVLREKLLGILKTYVKARKAEIKSKRQDEGAAETALSTYTLRYGAKNTSTPTARTQTMLLRLLVAEKMMLPTDKKLGSSMSGAFLIWDPLLTRLCHAALPLPRMLSSLLGAMNAPSASRSMLSPDMDPVKQGFCEWAAHMLRSDIFQSQCLTASTLAECFSDPTFWSIKLAEALLQDEHVPHRRQWMDVLDAAQNDTAEDAKIEAMHVDAIEHAQPVASGEKVKQKIQGPRKVVGLWKARPIGWVPEGCEDDE